MSEIPTITNKDYSRIASQLSVKPSAYTKPVRLYVDVDGVIKPETASKEEMLEQFPNAVELDVLPPYSWQDELSLIRGWFWFDEEVIKRLAALSHSPYVDFVWLTDWRVSAPHALDDLLGIKSIGYLDWQRKFSDYNQTFKRVAIEEDQEEAPSKFVWIDDRANRPYGDAPHVFASENYDAELEFDEDGNLLTDIKDAYIDTIPASQYLNVITDARKGLTIEDIETIEKWVQENI